ncbi:MAG: aminotransferase class I/II-fold pyridoxal phosphate-dependent enzyme, partial [Bacilli bacterium]|nr:aminotransferase class I/II-fold pyridoxal phosphate-dependent enzyme [Bacilli bacterium]
CALSPTKAFNLVGIQTAAVYSKRDDLAKAIAVQLNIDECNEPNAFSYPAAVAAFRASRQYLIDLNQIISRNRKIATAFFEKECPLFHVVPQNATYLLWVDISKLTKEDEAFAGFLKEEAKVWVTEGSHYGEEGKGFLRINIACPLPTLEEGLKRIGKGYGRFLQRKDRP